MRFFGHHRQFIGFSMLALCMLVAGCAAPQSRRTGAARLGPAAPRVTLEIATKGDALQFDQSELTAPAGSVITLRFKNNAEPTMQMTHNWVLVVAGHEDRVAADGGAAGAGTGYVKKDDDNVIAATGLVKGGAIGEVTFDAPEPGRYVYICTFPGHNTLMKGTLTIT